MNTTDDHSTDGHCTDGHCTDGQGGGVTPSGAAGDLTQGGGAVSRAEAGVAGWEDAVRLQRWATPDHAEFYALAGEVVATLHALDDLARVLRGQVGGYGRGRVVYDDTRQVDPGRRLAQAGTDLDVLGDRLLSAERAANSFFSGIGHIGVEEATS